MKLSLIVLALSLLPAAAMAQPKAKPFQVNGHTLRITPQKFLSGAQGWQVTSDSIPRTRLYLRPVQSAGAHQPAEKVSLGLAGNRSNTNQLLQVLGGERKLLRGALPVAALGDSPLGQLAGSLLETHAAAAKPSQPAAGKHVTVVTTNSAIQGGTRSVDHFRVEKGTKVTFGESSYSLEPWRVKQLTDPAQGNAHRKHRFP